MGKAYDVPTGNAPPEQPEARDLQVDALEQPPWVTRLNAGAQDVAKGIANAVEVAEPFSTEAPAASAEVSRPSTEPVLAVDNIPCNHSAPATEPAVIQSPVPAPLTVALPNQAVETLLANDPPTAAKPAPAEAVKLVCLIKGCKCKQKLRGLCSKCHTAAVKWVDDRKRFPNKEAGWACLEANGLSLPPCKSSSDKLFLDAVEICYETIK